jgi:hypothetical protein
MILTRTGDARDLSLIDRRQQLFQEAIDRLVVDPADHGHHIVVGIDMTL